MRAIDGDELKRILDCIDPVSMSVQIQAVLDLIDNMPTIEPEDKKVIYCGECKHMQVDDIFHDCWCNGKKVFVNHYCGYAKRRESG